MIISCIAVILVTIILTWNFLIAPPLILTLFCRCAQFALPHPPSATAYEITGTLLLHKSTAAFMRSDCLAWRTLGNSIFFQKNNTQWYRAIKGRTPKVSIAAWEKQKNMREMVREEGRKCECVCVCVCVRALIWWHQADWGHYQPCRKTEHRQRDRKREHPHFNKRGPLPLSD